VRARARVRVRVWGYFFVDRKLQAAMLSNSFRIQILFCDISVNIFN